MKAVEVISTALRKRRDGSTSKNGERRRTGWRSSLAVLPGIGTSLLPVGVCPACWPAYAGLFSTLGFGFLLQKAYLLPLTAVFLMTAVATMAYKARTRRGSGPFALGFAASAVVLGGKFVVGSDVVIYGGIATLVAASLWNAWPRRKVGTGKEACPACASAGESSQPMQAGRSVNGKERLP